jgi:UDP-N-acetylmuramate: L-alanyl-gamma-D-glutamyl-meso-diaminopimelate ligase
VETFALSGEANWSADFVDEAETRLAVSGREGVRAETPWKLGGAHNLENALAAIAAARNAGVTLEVAMDALSRFDGVKRRMELTATVAEVAVYDDFAHHPTAIRRSLQGLRKRFPGRRLVVALDPRSNTMKLGVHNATLAASLEGADLVRVYRPPELGPAFDEGLRALGERVSLYPTYDDLAAALAAEVRAGDRVVFMSNGGFGIARVKLPAGRRSRRDDERS